MATRPPTPPFSHDTATEKVRLAEDAWNSRDPARVALAYTEDSRWRNRVSSRWLLARPFRPIRHARGLHCPWLVCVGDADRVAKPGPAIRAGASARAVITGR